MKTTKLVSVVAVVLLLIAVLCCGCGEEQAPKTEPAAQLTASEVLKAAMDKVEEEYEIKATIGVTMQTSGMNVDMPMEMTTKCAKKDGAVVTLSDISLSLMGQNIEMSVYTEGDTAYNTVSFSGITSQYKAPLDESAIPNVNLLEGLGGDGELNIPEEALTMTEEADGGKTISLTMPTETLNELMNSTMSAAGNATAGDVNFKECVATVKIDKDGNLAVITMKMEGSMNDPTAGEVTYIMDFSVQYLNPGQPVTVTPPDGYLEFPSQDEMELAL